MINHRDISRVDRAVPLSVAAAMMILGLVAGCTRSADARVRPSSSAVPVSPPTPSSGEAVSGGPSKATAAPAPASEAAPLLLDIEGMRREMQKARGHTLFVHLWASWCGPCLGELPLVDRFARSARARGATVLSVSLDNDGRGIARVPEVLHARAPTLTTFVAQFDDPEKFMALFSRAWEGAIPALFAFDRTGKLSASLIGEVDPSELDALVARLPAGPGSAPAAPPHRTPPGEQSR